MRKGSGQVRVSGVAVRTQTTIPKAPPVARPVTVSERDSWLQAASHRNPPRVPDVKKLREWLFRRNARKYLKLQELIRWAEGEYGREFGILPEDARWLLP